MNKFLKAFEILMRDNHISIVLSEKTLRRLKVAEKLAKLGKILRKR